MRKQLILTALLLLGISAHAQQKYKTEKDIPYISTSETDAYRKERCKLDIYYPEGKTDFQTVVWFHGGGLTGGSKHIPDELKEKGIAVIPVNYRLSPKATHPAYIDDSAEAVAWVFRNIEKYGGNPDKIVVAGHSAGGYLALMLALDKSCLAKYGADADKVMAYFPLSGQTMTHYTIRVERNMPDGIPFIDKYAPIQHARANTPPIYLVTGDRNLEMAARYEENAILYAVLKDKKNDKVYLHELGGFDHGNMFGPGCIMLTEYLRKLKN